MSDFDDIIEQYEQIKDTPDVLSKTTVKDNASKGVSADNLKSIQNYLPSPKSHIELQTKLTDLFDKTSRSGAQSKAPGMILPGGRKKFAHFHDNFTGTGRFTPQKTPDKVDFGDKAPKVEPYPHRVILFQRCADCNDPIDKENFVPNMLPILPGELLAPEERAKWASVDIKPETLLCYFFCINCPAAVAANLQTIRQDPIKSQMMVGIGPDGKPITVSDKEAQTYLAERSAKISKNVFEQIKYHRDIRDNSVFFGNARIC
jgi:hypothetical protein